MTRKLWVGVTVLGVLAAATAWFVLHHAPRTRVLLIGLDGAEWDMINPLIAKGRLPNLARVKSEGVHGTLQSFEPILSPLIWTSIATGKTPEKHGIGWFMVQSEKTGERLPVTSNVRKCQAIWNILSDHDRSAGILGWWATYPAETVKGFVISDFLAYHNFGVTGQNVRSDLGKTYPLDLIDEIKPMLQRHADVDPGLVRSIANVTDADVQACQGKAYDFGDLLSHFLHILATAENYTRIGTDLFAKRECDLFAVYYEGIDSVSHLFMRYQDPPQPGISAENRSRFGLLVEKYYEYQDRILGRYLELADEHTIVAIVSDHGFKVGSERPEEGDKVEVGLAHQWHNLDGVILVKGPGIKTGEEMPPCSVLDITPTILYALGLPVAEDMDGHVILDAFRTTYLARHPVAKVESFEVGSAHTKSDVKVEEGVAHAMEDRLRQLGYVGSSKDDSSPEIHMNLARQHLDKGNPNAAERELKIALRMTPNDPTPHVLLANIYRGQNRFGDAKREVQFASSLKPDDLNLWMRIANLSALSGELEEATAALTHVAGIDAKWPGVHVALGDVLNRSGKLDLAEAALRKALEVDQKDVSALFNLGVVLDRQGRGEEAVASYRSVLEIQPKHAYAHNNLGSLFAKLGRNDEAYREIKASLELDPENFEALYNLGTTCLKLDKNEEALDALKKAVGASPDRLWARKNLALAYLRNKQALKAFQEYASLTKQFPDDYDCWINAARLPKRPERDAEVIAFLAGAWRVDAERTRKMIQEDAELKGIDSAAVELLVQRQSKGAQGEGARPPDASGG